MRLRSAHAWHAVTVFAYRIANKIPKSTGLACFAALSTSAIYVGDSDTIYTADTYTAESLSRSDRYNGNARPADRAARPNKPGARGSAEGLFGFLEVRRVG
ncbi:MAG: hypothetical protein M1834_005523 [Cirrosporium novae-zelandiae]|nr:MAG: hypothetical protein M1834_005523 [Cirrosporium novae-zelandiae]